MRKTKKRDRCPDVIRSLCNEGNGIEDEKAIDCKRYS